MKMLFPLLLVAVLATSCVTYRQVSRDANPTWAGCTTTQIIQAMGSPDRIDSDGAGGAILRYDSQPDYEDPSYDILNPEPAPAGQRGVPAAGPSGRSPRTGAGGVRSRQG